MRKYLMLLSFFIAGFFLFPSQLHAFEHGYQSHTDEIYATVRHDLAVYYDTSGEEFKEYLPAFSGVTVTGSSGSWYEVEYKTSSGQKSGWVTKDDFTYDCLIYDGREKQLVADGSYRFTYHISMENYHNALSAIRSKKFGTDSLFTCQIVFVGDDSYKIFRKDTKQYLIADSLFRTKNSCRIWGNASQAGLFRLIRKGDYYGIQDCGTNRYFGLTVSNLLGFTNQTDIAWRLTRTGGKVLDKNSMRVFTQFDADWAGKHYGRGKNEDPSTNNFCTSGCGIFATVNAIYTLTGHFAKPHILADYAVEKYFRIEGHGTDSGFFKAAAKKFGHKYGFAYDGSSGSLDEAKKKLEKGDTVIAYVPGHYTTIVDYDKKKKKFLLYDPHYLPKRGTCSFGDWVSQSDLESGDLMAQMFFFYKPVKK